ncbi:hypothetical protein MCOR20_001587 [Pyricularia oryzae]|nr:hypothetical protein MCOR20_001587 [Pyricularia oryzae]
MLVLESANRINVETSTSHAVRLPTPEFSSRLGGPGYFATHLMGTRSRFDKLEPGDLPTELTSASARVPWSDGYAKNRDSKMRFSTVAVLTIFGAVQATPIAAPEPVLETAVDAPIEARAILSGGEDFAPAQLEKRLDPITTSIVVAAGSALATKAVDAAVKAVGNAIKGLQNWDKVREEFTKKTVSEMWAKIDKKAYSAAVCYNMDYDAPNIDGKTSVAVKSGLLKTTYDCFFMKAGAQTFKGKGDGGFQNMAAQHDSRCTYDSKAITLTCK